MSIEAMKQALEALDSLLYWDNGKPEYDEAREAITALRAAIEQAEKQEPVAWMKEGGFRSQVTFDWRIAKREGLTIPLYSRPQLACAPTHEPVATMTVRHTKNKTEIGYGPASKGYDLPNGEYKLYTTPPAAPVHELEKGCHRSHPHENMDAMCKLRTEIARLTNENARLKAAAPVQELERLRDENERLHVENRRLIDRIETMGVPVGVGGFLTTTNAAQRQWVGLMRGVRVDGGSVIVSTKSNDAARKLCGELLREKNGGQA